MEFKMIEGTPKEVEVQLNTLKENYWVQVEGMSSTEVKTVLCLNLVSLEDEAFALHRN